MSRGGECEHFIAQNFRLFTTSLIVQIYGQERTTTTTTTLFSYIKYTNIIPPANSKANQGRWCVDSLRSLHLLSGRNRHFAPSFLAMQGDLSLMWNLFSMATIMFFNSEG